MRRNVTHDTSTDATPRQAEPDAYLTCAVAPRVTCERRTPRRPRFCSHLVPLLPHSPINPSFVGDKRCSVQKGQRRINVIGAPPPFELRLQLHVERP